MADTKPRLTIAITSTVVLEVHNPPATLEALTAAFREANESIVGEWMETTSKVIYRLKALERLEVEVRG